MHTPLGWSRNPQSHHRGWSQAQHTTPLIGRGTLLLLSHLHLHLRSRHLPLHQEDNRHRDHVRRWTDNLLRWCIRKLQVGSSMVDRGRIQRTKSCTALRRSKRMQLGWKFRNHQHTFPLHGYAQHRTLLLLSHAVYLHHLVPHYSHLPIRERIFYHSFLYWYIAPPNTRRRMDLRKVLAHRSHHQWFLGRRRRSRCKILGRTHSMTIEFSWVHRSLLDLSSAQSQMVSQVSL